MTFLSEWPTWSLVAVLLGLMFAADEAGFQAGRASRDGESEPSRAASGALKASVFALVAFLLGFSFSATANRHDARRKVVLDEANAIGTCHLRAGLLDDATAGRIRRTLRRLTEVRLEHFEKGRDAADLARTAGEMRRQLDGLWEAVEAATRADPAAVRTSRIVEAANAVIDLDATRTWAAGSHLQPPVLVLLVAATLVASVLAGHSSGQSGRRHVGLWLAFNVLFALVLYVVLDYDRPRRGLIQVDHAPLVELLDSMPPATR